ncbi:enediyne biosynthesis thioesterase [Sinosporangium album]|uniref:Enediyne biosynthesis thioesterase n=1 Tax=Sinosporangium album TaxID=504805 RepID=A0A1G8F2W5_9ACTN|nr:acyl-CoA thioesterase [Sinosporangium album]SDH76349.1 enediyne biosynthesis thioesterase [Sinosporangium album]
MKTYNYRHLVTFEETNLVGNVYFTNYLRWQGHCRERFLADRAPGTLRSLRDGLALVTVNCRCDYFAELFALDQVELRMSLGGVEGNRVRMLFDYYRLPSQASSRTPELVARGEQTVACMARTADGDTTHADVPGEFARALEPYRTERTTQ